MKSFFHHLLLLICAPWGSTIAAGSEQTQQTWVAVGSPERLAAVRPLAEWRKKQGFNVSLSVDLPQSTAGTPKPDFLLLLGDDRDLPAQRMPYYRWESKQPETFPSDMALADFDQDGFPDFAVGRFPFSDPKAIRQAAEKTVRWEQRRPQFSDLSMPIWAGDPNFGPLIKSMAMGMMQASLDLFAPKWLDIWMLNGDAEHALGGWVEAHPQMYLQRIRQGGCFSSMMGHGRSDEFWSLDFAGKRIAWQPSHAAELSAAEPLAPHLIFACSCGGFHKARKWCVSESLLAAPGGPVACVAATEESHPLTNYYSSTAFLRTLKEGTARTFGRLWLELQKDALHRTEKEKELFLAHVEGQIHGKMEPALLKRDHMLLYNITGDPATRVFLPEPLPVALKRNAEGNWSWNVTKPDHAGRLRVQFRQVLSSVFPARANDAPREEAERLFAEANSRLAFHDVVELDASGEWKGSHAHQPGTLRFIAETPDGWHAFGADLR
jgi:hypothetical protein